MSEQADNSANSQSPSQGLPPGMPTTMPDGKPIPPEILQRLEHMHQMLPRLPFFKFIFGLFAIPRRALLISRLHSFWGKSLLGIILVSILGGCLFSIKEHSQNQEISQDGVAVASKAFTKLSYSPADSRLSWESPQPVPFTLDSKRFALAVVANEKDVDTKALANHKQNWGILVTGEAIKLWLKSPSVDNAVYLQDITKNCIPVFQQLGFPDNNAYSLSSKEISQLQPVFTASLHVVDFLRTFVDLVELAFFTFIIMLAISFMVRRMDNAPLSGTLSTALAATIPPMFVTDILICLNTTISSDNLNLIAVALYFIILYIDRSVKVKRNPIK